MIEITKDNWMKITENHYVHPQFGYIKFTFWGKWEAHSSSNSFIIEFNTLERAMAYLEKE